MSPPRGPIENHVIPSGLSVERWRSSEGSLSAFLIMSGMYAQEGFRVKRRAGLTRFDVDGRDRSYYSGSVEKLSES